MIGGHYSLDERKRANRERANQNPWHRDDGPSERVGPTHPTEEVEDRDENDREVAGTWGERDAGGVNESEALEQYV